MALQMYITDMISGAVFDVTEIIVKASYTTSITGQPGKLSFTLSKDPNNVLQVSLGSKVAFYSNNTKVFLGYVFSVETDESENFEILAYDKMRYLQNHDYYFVEDGKKTFLQFFSDLCGKINVTYTFGMGVVPPADMLSQQFFADKSYFEMIQHYIDEMNVKNPALRYFLRDSFGKLELNEITAAFLYGLDGIMGGNPPIIGDESLLTEYHYGMDIDTDTCNEVLLVADSKEGADKAKHIMFARQDNAAIRSYGLLRQIKTVQKGMTESQIMSFASDLLKAKKHPTKTMTLKALGYDGIYAGSGFVMKLDKLRVMANMYVITATHDYEGGQHTMSLDVDAASVSEILTAGGSRVQFL